MTLSVIATSIYGDWHLINGVNGLGYGSVTILTDGQITADGYRYLLEKLIKNVVGHLIALRLFWFFYLKSKINQSLTLAHE
jgi:hypothetical protein